MDIWNIITAIATVATALFIAYELRLKMLPNAKATPIQQVEDGWWLVHIQITPKAQERTLYSISSKDADLCHSKWLGEEGGFQEVRSQDLPSSRLVFLEVIPSSDFSITPIRVSLYARSKVLKSKKICFSISFSHFAVLSTSTTATISNTD